MKRSRLVGQVVQAALLVVGALAVGLMAGCNSTDAGTNTATAAASPPVVEVAAPTSTSFYEMVHNSQCIWAPSYTLNLADSKYLLFDYRWNDDVHTVLLPLNEAQQRRSPEAWISTFQIYERVFIQRPDAETAGANWFQLGGHTELLNFGGSSSANAPASQVSTISSVPAAMPAASAPASTAPTGNEMVEYLCRSCRETQYFPRSKGFSFRSGHCSKSEFGHDWAMRGLSGF